MLYMAQILQALVQFTSKLFIAPFDRLNTIMVPVSFCS